MFFEGEVVVEMCIHIYTEARGELQADCASTAYV